MDKTSNKISRAQLVEKLAALPPESTAWARAHRALMDWDLANAPDVELITMLWQGAFIALAIIGAAYLGSVWMAGQ